MLAEPICLLPLQRNCTGSHHAGESTLTRVANDIVGFPDDPAGYNIVLGSRLIPDTAYLRNPSSVGVACKQLLSQGIKSILGLLFTGGM